MSQALENADEQNPASMDGSKGETCTPEGIFLLPAALSPGKSGHGVQADPCEGLVLEGNLRRLGGHPRRRRCPGPLARCHRLRTHAGV